MPLDDESMFTWVRDDSDPHWHLLAAGGASCGRVMTNPTAVPTSKLPERPQFCGSCRRDALSFLDEVA